MTSARPTFAACLTAAALAVLAAARPARAQTVAAEAKTDLAVKTGIYQGTITRPLKTTGITQRSTTGGVPLALAWTRDLSSRWSLVGELALAVDPQNSQLFRKAGAGTASYHVLGGSRRVVRSYKSAEVVASTPYDVSLALQAAYASYDIVVKDSSDSISGSVLELAPGVQFRQDIGPTASLGVEAFYAAASIPASVDRLAVRALTLSLVARWLL